MINISTQHGKFPIDLHNELSISQYLILFWSGYFLDFTYLDHRAVLSSRNISRIWYDKTALLFLNMEMKLPNDKKCNI